MNPQSIHSNLSSNRLRTPGRRILRRPLTGSESPPLARAGSSSHSSWSTTPDGIIDDNAFIVAMREIIEIDRAKPADQFGILQRFLCRNPAIVETRADNNADIYPDLCF